MISSNKKDFSMKIIAQIRQILKKNKFQIAKFLW
jgi:hypothetical protein